MKRFMAFVLCVTLLPLLVASACAPDERTGSDPDLSQRQRDSAIGASRLPGAHGVTRALGAADSASVRSARLDSIASEP